MRLHRDGSRHPRRTCRYQGGNRGFCFGARLGARAAADADGCCPPKEIGGEKIVYIALDDESDSTKGIQNARRLVIQDGVDVLIGSSLTPVTMPMLDVAWEAKTPIISLAAATAIVQPMDERRKWAFKVVPNDDLMAFAILKHIAKSGAKTLGYIGVSDGYGEGYYKEVSRLAPTLGLTLTTHEVYARADSSVTGQALKVMATNPDAVFIASAGTPAVLPQQALRERGYSGKIYQTHGVATENSSSSAAPASKAPSSPARRSRSRTICRRRIRSARSETNCCPPTRRRMDRSRTSSQHTCGIQWRCSRRRYQLP